MNFAISSSEGIIAEAHVGSVQVGMGVLAMRDLAVFMFEANIARM